MIRKTHSTYSSFKLHQSLRLTLVTTIAIYIAYLAASGATLGVTASLISFLALVVGVLSAQIVDWILWYVSEWLTTKVLSK